MMARYRTNMSMRPIQRIKHVVDFSATLAAATQLDKIVVLATDTPTLAVVNEVITGSKVNGIYLKCEVGSNETDAGAIPNVYMIVTKNPGGNLTIPVPNAVGANDNKRFVIHQEMIMLNNVAGGNPRVLFNGVIVIPKGYRRMGPNDTIVVSFFSTALNITVCLQAHFKEFR